MSRRTARRDEVLNSAITLLPLTVELVNINLPNAASQTDSQEQTKARGSVVEVVLKDWHGLRVQIA